MKNLKQWIFDNCATWANTLIKESEKYKQIQNTLSAYEKAIYFTNRGYSSRLSQILKYGNKEAIIKFTSQQAEIKYNDILNKISKAGINQIIDFKLKNADNGSYEGIIKGENKTINIKVIYAGGYNIQRLHFRTLIKDVK